MTQLLLPQFRFGLLTCALFFVFPLTASCHPTLISGQPQLVVERLRLPMLKFNWTNISCRVCQVLFTLLDVALLSDINEERVAYAVGEACIRLHLADEQVCRNITELFREDFIRALQESLLWPSEACGLLLGPPCGKFDIYESWNITLPKDPKPPVTPPVPPKPGSPQSRVLFLTDIHWDKEYATGSAADCKEPLCCRNDSDFPQWRGTWLYDTMADEWSKWLPEPALKSLRYGGFYTTEIHPGLRLVSLNMNFCARENFWLMVNSTDPASQLQWLVHVLQASEDKGEKVHIIGHIPPSMCLGSWSWNYYHIVNRYESTITGQFFGHTHFDEFQMFYDGETVTRPLGVAFISPSVTTYINLNPGYRVYYVDGNYHGSSRLVLDHETYILNLTEANRKHQEHPKWTLLYRATEAYGLSSIFPSDLDGLIRGFIGDDRLFQKFWYFRHKGHVSEPCEETCKTAALCFLQSGRYDLLQQCNYIDGVKVRKIPC
ncbi:sphingomyelin phosphodiesterase [Hippocampus comes]|uniref:sphingomyelin phosphodiesterase n=1 Tax=Hippocampus comes TaxID=109280 RepID=UPI00094E2441|nr:PREDICTED: sphingomyelin phosphodiesterase [Hippocampus comes]